MEERVLRDLFGIAGVARHPEGQAVDAVPVPRNEEDECFAPSSSCVIGKGFVGGRAFGRGACESHPEDARCNGRTSALPLDLGVVARHGGAPGSPARNVRAIEKTGAVVDQGSMRRVPARSLRKRSSISYGIWTSVARRTSAGRTR